MSSYSTLEMHQKLSYLKSGILFMNTAAERIKTALELAEAKLNYFEYIVWIAPANFLNTLIYTNEIKKNSQNFRHRIKYYAPESLSVSDSKYLELYNLINNHKTFCIIDESLTIKNTRAGKTKRLLLLSRFFTYKLILSGTFVTQGLIDLYAQLEFLDNKILKMNEKQFSNIFMPERYPSYLIIKHWSRPQDENKLLKMIEPYILGYNINDKYIINHYNRYFELTPQETQSYMEEKQLYLQKKSRIVFMDIAQNFQKIYTISKNKLWGLQETLSEIQDKKEKVLIYLKFLDEIDFIKETKILKNTPYTELSGRTNKKRAIKAFERNTNIMFCTYGVEKFGLDMQICNNIIYCSQTFDYRCKLQSLDSVMFKGFPTYINIYDFWVNTKLEELIKESLEHKRNLLSSVCKKISKIEALQL